MARHEVCFISPSSPFLLFLLVFPPGAAPEIESIEADNEFLEDLGGWGGLLARELRLTNSPQHYRAYLIWRCPTVRFLDYRRVRDGEREKASDLFGTLDEPSALASKIMGIKSRTFDVPSLGTVNGVREASSTDRVSRVKLTEKEKKRVEGLIRNAKSLQEIARLEKELNEGRIPGGGVDAMEE